MTVHKSEFKVTTKHSYNHSTAWRWLLSHIATHWYLVFISFVFIVIGYSSFSYGRVLIGSAAEEIINPSGGGELLRITLMLLGVLVLDGLVSLAGSISVEILANRLERGAREELYTSLLGKSQMFHDQQRVGDIMARATDDVRQLNHTISPGLLFLYDMVLGFFVPITFLAGIHAELLIIPVIFLMFYIVSVRLYIRKLNPVIQEQRRQYGVMNAGLEETISGIEIVKVTAQEAFERLKFRRNVKAYRDLFVEQGRIEARYLPLLFYGITFGLMFLHTLILNDRGELTIPQIISVMGLVGVLRFPVFISLFSLSLIQLGVASAGRILHLINQETDIDENLDGYKAPVQGSITFENVSFGYEPDKLILKDVSFSVRAGQTVAIVGQTGSGKSTIMELIGRSYDVTSGRVLIDGVDVREWNLDQLRSQISKIEQDIFLFSRPIGDNIAFGAMNPTQEDIEHAAKEAQAHDFIMTFNEGYQTKVGDRGLNLSGGQRQRLALARAFLSDPRILMLDDSTSAIDSATEDEIQKAMRRAQEGRTTVMITHRVSQIRWADYIVLLENGVIVASGTHDELLKSSDHYRRIFARYDMTLPQLNETNE